MSSANEWITDRLPTEADGDRDGDVWIRHVSSSEHNFLAHWSHVGPGAPWQRTIYWKPPTEPTPTESTPTEPDRIAALEQQLKEHIRAQSVLAAALVKRLEALEGLSPDGAIPECGRGVPGGIAALEQQLRELETLFWAHKRVAQPVSIPSNSAPEAQS
jgi:hypothetical protein